MRGDREIQALSRRMRFPTDGLKLRRSDAGAERKSKDAMVQSGLVASAISVKSGYSLVMRRSIRRFTRAYKFVSCVCFFAWLKPKDDAIRALRT